MNCPWQVKFHSFKAGKCHANVRMHQGQAHMRSSGVPEQPVSIQHFKGILVGAREGQGADTQRILKWLKPYTQIKGVLIQVGSDTYMYCNFLTQILLHNIGVETFHLFCQNSLL